MIPSPIEWLWHWQNGWRVPGFTFNPWIGCEKVSAGCKNCYASVDTYARVSKSRGLPLWGPGSLRHRTSADYWKGPLRLAKKARELSQIVGFDVRPRVFPSLCDPFEDRIDLLAPRADLFELIEKTPEIDWLLLTKRTENVTRMVPRHWTFPYMALAGWPENVWLGTSVENQGAANERIPHLLQVPAKVRFLSVEPLLGPINLERFMSLRSDGKTLCCECCNGDRCDEPRHHDRRRCPFCAGTGTHRGIQWVIVGGESGKGARPMHPDWVRSIRDQCVASGVPFFFKQWGEWAPNAHGGYKLEDVALWNREDADGWIYLRDLQPDRRENWAEYQAGDVRMYRVGKKNAGRDLDGRTRVVGQ